MSDSVDKALEETAYLLNRLYSPEWSAAVNAAAVPAPCEGPHQGLSLAMLDVVRSAIHPEMADTPFNREDAVKLAKAVLDLSSKLREHRDVGNGWAYRAGVGFGVVERLRDKVKILAALVDSVVH